MFLALLVVLATLPLINRPARRTLTRQSLSLAGLAVGGVRAGVPSATFSQHARTRAGVALFARCIRVATPAGVATFASRLSAPWPFSRRADADRGITDRARTSRLAHDPSRAHRLQVPRHLPGACRWRSPPCDLAAWPSRTDRGHGPGISGEPATHVPATLACRSYRPVDRSCPCRWRGSLGWCRGVAGHICAVAPRGPGRRSYHRHAAGLGGAGHRARDHDRGADPAVFLGSGRVPRGGSERTDRPTLVPSCVARGADAGALSWRSCCQRS